MVFLTATMPPYKESRLFQRIAVEREMVSIYRARTSRHNVAYRIYRPMVRSKHRSQNQWLEDLGV
jgi:CRISPR/Cas system-associated endonuclease/helicase Cas3